MKKTRFKKGQIPWNKGKKGLQVAWNKGVPMTEIARERLIKNHVGTRGKKFTDEHKEKLRLSNISPENIEKQKLCRKGDKNYLWKGELAGYVSKHMWISHWFGKATKCEECGLDKIPKNRKRYFHWSNISHKYLRKREDWRQLCVKCHKQYDLKWIKNR